MTEADPDAIGPYGTVRLQATEAARDAARAELVDWPDGGTLARAWQALLLPRARS